MFVIGSKIKGCCSLPFYQTKIELLIISSVTSDNGKWKNVFDFGGCSIRIIWESSFDMVWPSVPCCNDGFVGVMNVTSWSTIEMTSSELELVQH